MSLVILPRQIIVDQNGKPRVGARLWTYDAQTNNPRVSYTTPSYLIPHTNPVLSLGNGFFPAIYVNASGGDYKIVVTDSNDFPIWTEDSIPVRDKDFDRAALVQTLYPQSLAESTLGISPVNFEYQAGDVRRYGNVGTLNDSSVLTQALSQAAHVSGAAAVIPRGITLNVRDVAIPTGVGTLRIDGELVGVTGGSSILTLDTGNDNVTVTGAGRVNLNGLTYGIRNTDANYLKVSGITFLGHVLGSYVFSEGDYAEVRECTVLPGYDCSNIPFKLYGKSPKFINNQLFDVRGFNVQFAFCEDAICEGNTFKNPTYTATATAVGSQSVFTGVDLTSINVDRWAAHVNGVQRQIAGTPSHTGSGLYNITLSSPASNGQTVTFFGSRSLENIQCNSECNGAVIANNICDGTGDSSIISVADYHDGVINPGAVDEDDYPRNIVVVGNVCKNSHGCSINMTHALGHTVTGNSCSLWGLRHDTEGGPFYCAIFSSSNNGVIDANVMVANGSRTQYGIGGWNSSADTSGEDFRRRAVRRKFGKNQFRGTFTSHYFAGISGVNTERKFDIDIDDGDFIEYPVQLQASIDAVQTVPGTPNDVAGYWDNQIATGPAPVTYDTTNILGGIASAQLVAGKSWQATPLAKELFQYSILKVSFSAYNSGAQHGYLEIYYDNGENDAEPRLTVTVLDTVWDTYEILIPIKTYGSQGLFFRFNGPVSGTTNFTHVRLLYKPLNIT